MTSDLVLMIGRTYGWYLSCHVHMCKKKWYLKSKTFGCTGSAAWKDVNKNRLADYQGLCNHSIQLLYSEEPVHLSLARLHSLACLYGSKNTYAWLSLSWALKSSSISKIAESDLRKLQHCDVLWKPRNMHIGMGCSWGYLLLTFFLSLC